MIIATLAAGAELIAAIALGIVSAATSTIAITQQNKAIRQQMRQQAAATKIQSRQLNAAAELERERLARQAASIRGRLRVSAAEAGVALEGSTAALILQTDIEEKKNAAVLSANLINQLDLVRTGGQANLATLSSQISNPAISGISGGIGGFRTGLNLAGEITALRRIEDERSIQLSRANAAE